MQRARQGDIVFLQNVRDHSLRARIKEGSRAVPRSVRRQHEAHLLFAVVRTHQFPGSLQHRGFAFPGVVQRVLKKHFHVIVTFLRQIVGDELAKDSAIRRLDLNIAEQRVSVADILIRHGFQKLPVVIHPRKPQADLSLDRPVLHIRHHLRRKRSCLLHAPEGFRKLPDQQRRVRAPLKVPIHFLHIIGWRRIFTAADHDAMQTLIVHLHDLLRLHFNILPHFLAQERLQFLRCKSSKFSDIHL